MIKLRRAVIVESKYDKIKLSSLLDTVSEYIRIKKKPS